MPAPTDLLATPRVQPPAPSRSPSRFTGAASFLLVSLGFVVFWALPIAALFYLFGGHL